MSREGKLTASTDMLDLGMALWVCHFFTGEVEWATELGRKSLANASMLTFFALGEWWMLTMSRSVAERKGWYS